MRTERRWESWTYPIGIWYECFSKSFIKTGTFCHLLALYYLYINFKLFLRTLNVDWLLVSVGLVWVFQKLLIYWDFHTQLSLRFREWSKKEKISSERQLCGWKCLVDVRGQRRMGRLVRDDRKATVSQIITRLQPRYAEYHLWTHTTCWTLK